MEPPPKHHELMLYNHSTDVVAPFKGLQLPRMPARRPSSGERRCFRAAASLALGLLLGYLAASALSRSAAVSSAQQEQCTRLLAPLNRTLGPEELVLSDLKVRILRLFKN
jgi:hypothetical protein